jgi:hypothetical protein
VLETLITSRTRLRLLLRFFLNSHSKAHLRGLAEEFGESTNAIRQELNNLSKAGYLISSERGNTIEYSANIQHPLYPELQKIIHKYLGIDKIIDKVINQILTRVGELEVALITGEYANGKDTGIIDLVLVGSIDLKYTNNLVIKAEKAISRKIRLLVLTNSEFEKNKKSLNTDTALCLWRKESV